MFEWSVRILRSLIIFMTKTIPIFHQFYKDETSGYMKSNMKMNDNGRNIESIKMNKF